VTKISPGGAAALDGRLQVHHCLYVSFFIFVLPFVLLSHPIRPNNVPVLTPITALLPIVGGRQDCRVQQHKFCCHPALDRDSYVKGESGWGDACGISTMPTLLHSPHQRCLWDRH
jgi:hypothetical protein